MQWATDIRQIKAAIFDQAFRGLASVSCPMGRVVAVRRRKGQLLAMVRLVSGGSRAHCRQSMFTFVPYRFKE